MADSEVDTTQQVTSPTPATKIKNPKRVAAGKAIAEKTRQAREQQKKALAEAQVILANQKIKKKDEPPVAAPVPAPVPAPVASTMNVLTTTQWLSVISIVVALGGIYYKREEIKARFSKKPPPQAHPPSPVDAAPQPVVPKKRRGICHME